MSYNNRVKPIPPILGSSRKTMPSRASTGFPEFLEKDINMDGIIKERNNYPQAISYYGPINYYDTEENSSYFEIIYQ